MLLVLVQDCLLRFATQEKLDEFISVIAELSTERKRCAREEVDNKARAVGRSFRKTTRDIESRICKCACFERRRPVHESILAKRPASRKTRLCTRSLDTGSRLSSFAAGINRRKCLLYALRLQRAFERGRFSIATGALGNSETPHGAWSDIPRWAREAGSSY